MIKIRWIITDDIENVSIEEFDREWPGIDGYFELRVNDQIYGYCPDRELFEGEESAEDILFCLYGLVSCCIQLAEGHEYEMEPLLQNLRKFLFKKNGNLIIISYVDAGTYEVDWSETIEFQEFCNEVRTSVDKFIAEIRRLNAGLLTCRLVKTETAPFYDERFIKICSI